MNPRIKKIGTFSDGNQLIEVWLVDVAIVKRDYDINFSEGGHHERYKFIPDNEAWLDSHLPVSELEFTLFDHELPEHWLMKIKKLSYYTAHDLVNVQELKARRRGRSSSKLRS